MKAQAIKREEVLKNRYELAADEVREKSNPLANVWLAVLGILLIGTLLCTAVLVAWPIIANMVAAG
jgi:hypothetical protein